MRPSLFLSVVSLMLGVLSLPLDGAALAVPAAHAAPADLDVPRFEPGPCPIEVPEEPEIECGTLVATEDHDDPDGRVVRLPVLIVHSPSAHPAPDPLLVTLGGPGYTSVGEVWGYARSPYVQERDIIIFEQRGNLYAEPGLDCDVSLWIDEREGHTPCLDSLLARGIDPADYTAADIAADIGDLFEVLARARGHEQWNLYGSSFATRPLLLAMRDYPQRIRSAALQSVNSPLDTRYAHDPEHSVRALQVLFRDCAADPACAAAYPDLEERFYDLYSRLNADPVAFELPDPVTGEARLRTVDGFTLLEWIVGDAFYGASRAQSLTTFLPLLIDRVEQGRTDLLYPWVKEQWRRVNQMPFAWGLYFSVNCQDDAWPGASEAMRAQTAAYPELEGYIRHAREMEICEAWDLEAAPPLLDAPLQSDIPALVLAGSYDPITAPEWSRATAKALGSATYVEFPGYGHDVNTGNPCFEQIMLAFLRNPGSRLDTGCAAAPPDFVLPGDLTLVPNVYEYYFDDIGRNRLEHTLYLASENGLLLVLLLSVAIALAWLALRRWRHVTFDGLVWAGLVGAGLLAALLFGFSQEMRDVVRDVASSSGALLRFGVPVAVRPWFALALAAAVLAAVLAALVVAVWLRQRGPLWGRVAVTVATLPVVAFAVLIGLWGWLGVLI